MAAFNLFKKPKAEAAKKPTVKKEVVSGAVVTSAGASAPADVTHTLRQIHVSEKASRLTGMSQYTFGLPRTLHARKSKKKLKKCLV